MGWRLYFWKEWEFSLLLGPTPRKHLDMVDWNMQSKYGNATNYFIEFLNRRLNNVRLAALDFRGSRPVLNSRSTIY